MAPRTAPSNGLCDTCAYQKRVANTRGSVFSLCLLSQLDPSYPRYPRVPVVSCAGHAARGRAAAGSAND